MEWKHFYFTKRADIILYGAATIGTMLYERLLQNDYNVIGFVDARADEIIQKFDLPVWSVDKIPDSIDRDNTIVLMAVKNVFDHDNIVEKLLKQEFRNIVYKPGTVLKGTENAMESCISEAYDAITDKCFAGTFSKAIPCTERIQPFTIENRSVYKKEAGQVVFLAPMEHIYTDVGGNTDKEDKSENIPVFMLYEHVGFFSFLDGNQNMSYEDYVEYCTKAAAKLGKNTVQPTEAWKMYTIRNRLMIFQEMAQKLECDYDFFINNAPKVTLNSKGYLNLNSGKHRAAFLVAKKRMFMPVRISEAEYSVYVRDHEVNKFYGYMLENSIRELKCPIPNPYFYSVQCPNRSFLNTLVRNIGFYLAKYFYIKKLRVFIDLEDDGYLARYLSYTCDKVGRNEKSDMEERINAMFSITNITYGESIQEYDVIVTEKVKDGGMNYTGYLNGKLTTVCVVEVKNCE